MTRPPQETPAEPVNVEIGFEKGLPVSHDGTHVDPVGLITRLNELAGAHGVGRIDVIEDRLVGIKSREVYEAPASVTLLAAHEAIESLTLSKEQRRFKAQVSQEYADLIYNGLWYSTHHQNLRAYVDSTQRHVTGSVRVKLHKGTDTVVGRKSPFSLYDFSLATYDKEDQFDRTAAVGFINIWGLPVKVQAQTQPVDEGPQS
jgi:argininosuccinate synthase